VNFGRIFEKKLRLNHVGDIFSEKNAPNTKNIAQVAKFCQVTLSTVHI
jgi:hypothetical protein